MKPVIKKDKDKEKKRNKKVTFKETVNDRLGKNNGKSYSRNSEKNLVDTNFTDVDKSSLRRKKELKSIYGATFNGNEN